MKKTITNKLGIILLLSLSLTSCGAKDNYVGNIASVDNVVISSEAYSKQLDFYQKYYSKKYGENYLETTLDSGKTNNELLQKDLIDSMIKDQVMLNDLNDKKIIVDDSKASSIRNELENQLGGRDSLKANIKAMGLTENEFNDNLYRDSIRRIHYEYFLGHNDIKDSEILEYYKENDKYQKQYKYNVLVFDDKKEAEKVFASIKDAKDFNSYLKKPVKNYDVINSDFVYADDPYLVRSGVNEKDQVSNVFEDEGSYKILMINSYNENENDLLIKLKEIYLKEKYQDYLDKLVKKSKIRVFV